jgi:hypothetical protein
MTDKTIWPKVSRQRHCPICGRPDGCLISPDGTYCICARTEPGSIRLIGEAFRGGWLHKLAEPIAYVPPPKPEPKKVKQEDFAPLAEKCHRALLDMPGGMEALSKELGLSVEYLEEGGAGWSAEYRSYTAPMYDGHRHIIGIQRRTPQGKRSIPGSHGGLFWPKGVSVQGLGPLLLPEGFTSCGACRDLRFDAIGRFNCAARIDLIRELVSQCPPQRLIVIVADHDKEHYRLDGSTYFPGQEGAAGVAKAISPIHRLLKIIKPPFRKDMRDWLHAGATHEMVELLINSTRYV